MPFFGSHFLKGHISNSISNTSVSQQIYIGLFQGLLCFFIFNSFNPIFYLHSIPPSTSTPIAFLFTDLWVHCLFWNQICPTEMKFSFSSNNPKPIHSSHTYLIRTFLIFSLTTPHLCHMLFVGML